MLKGAWAAVSRILRLPWRRSNASAHAEGPASASATMLAISTADGLLWARLGIDREHRLRARLTPGSYGAVFRAHSESAGDVAIKAIPIGDARVLALAHDALVVAAKRAAQIDDPSILVPFACERRETALFYATPWVPGGSVADILSRTEPLSLARVTSLIRAVAGPLDRAHARGLVHGGVRPGNILLGTDGRLLLGDFGVSAALESLAVPRNAQAARGQAFAAPEQWRGNAVDGRADQYALALIAYELLTATTRFDARGVEGVPTLAALEITDSTPIRPGLPLYVNAALRRALSANPANRFTNVGTFVDAMEGKRVDEAAGLPTVRFRLADIRPRHVVITLGGLVTCLMIAVAADVGTDGRLRQDAKLLYRRFAPALPGAASPTSAQSASSAGGGGGGGGARVVDIGGGTTGGRGSSSSGGSSGASSGGSGPSGGLASRSGPPNYGPEITGTAGGRRSTGYGARPTAGSASGKRVASSSLPAPAPPADSAAGQGARRSSSGTGALLAALYSRARAAAAGALGGASSADSSGAATATDGAVDVDAGGGSPLVTVDGLPRGTAPTTIRLSPGQHTVAVHGGGRYTPSKVVVTVGRGTTTSATFRPVEKP